MELLFLALAGVSVVLGAAGVVSWREHRARSDFVDALLADPAVEPFIGERVGAKMRTENINIVALESRPPQWVVMSKPALLSSRTTMRVVPRADLLTASFTQRHGVKVGDEIDDELYITGGQPDVLRGLIMIPAVQLALRVLFSRRYDATKLEIDADGMLTVELKRHGHFDAIEAKTKLLQVFELVRLLDAHQEVAPVVEQSAGEGVGPTSGTPVVVPKM